MSAARKRTRSTPSRNDDGRTQRQNGATVTNRLTTRHKETQDLELLENGPDLIARLTVKDGITLNMGDYASFRRDVGLELDVLLPSGDPGPDEMMTEAQEDRINVVYDKMSDFIQDRLADAAADAREYFGD